jgi:hypothetical protein
MTERRGSRLYPLLEYTLVTSAGLGRSALLHSRREQLDQMVHEPNRGMREQTALDAALNYNALLEEAVLSGDFSQYDNNRLKAKAESVITTDENRLLPAIVPTTRAASLYRGTLTTNFKGRGVASLAQVKHIPEIVAHTQLSDSQRSMVRSFRQHTQIRHHRIVQNEVALYYLQQTRWDLNQAIALFNKANPMPSGSSTKQQERQINNPTAQSGATTTTTTTVAPATAPALLRFSYVSDDVGATHDLASVASHPDQNHSYRQSNAQDVSRSPTLLSRATQAANTVAQSMVSVSTSAMQLVSNLYNTNTSK